MKSMYFSITILLCILFLINKFSQSISVSINYPDDLHTSNLSQEINNLTFSYNTLNNDNLHNELRITSTKALSRKRRTVTVTKNRIWDNGIIPYEIDDNYSGIERTIFRKAMYHWENHTCIKFVERNPEQHPNYVQFIEKSCGCCSNIGKRGRGVQFVSINEDCSEVGIVTHELGHAIGFYHEHTRPDRDDYVHIISENIMPEALHNFAALSLEKIAPLTQPYDYDSIMHYASDTFSNDDSKDTIIPIEKSGRDPNTIGQRERLSEGDIIQTNLLYNCQKCGRTFLTNKNQFESPIYENLKEPSKQEYCEWRIHVSQGQKIIFTVKSLNIFKSHSCHNDYLEIKDGYDDKSPILAHICGKQRRMKPIISSGNYMLIMYKKTSTEHKYTGFTAKYEAVCGGDIFIKINGTDYLESPDYPESYPKSLECIWSVSVPEGHNVMLKFQSFKFQDDNSNFQDYLEIRNGDNKDSPLLGHYSNSTLPLNVQSNGNKLFIKFVSNNNLKTAEFLGFSASLLIIN